MTLKQARKLLKKLIESDKGNPRRAIVKGMYEGLPPFKNEHLSERNP